MPGFGDFLPFFFGNPLKLGQVGWGPSVSPEMSDRVHVCALAGSLSRCWFGCVLRVIIMLEGEPSAQSVV